MAALKAASCAAALALVACNGVTSEPPPGEFLVQLDGADDRVQLAIENDGVVIEIFSPSGIGSGTMNAPASRWPQRIRLLLHLGGLEGLTLRQGERSWQIEVLRGGDALVEGGPPEPRVVRRGDHGPFEVEFAPDSREPLYFRWIDFYRD